MRLEGWRLKREESWWGRGYGRRAHEVHLLNHQHSHKKHLKSINQNINALRQIVWTVMSWECSGSPGWNPPPTGWGWPCCGCTVHLNLKDLNKEIQMYQGKAPDKSRAVFALSHSIMNEQEVPEEARSPGKPWFAHFFSLCPSYFKSFLNYPLILHLSDPGSFFSVTSALMLAFSSSGTFFSLST